jgi:hypothetical protein
MLVNYFADRIRSDINEVETSDLYTYLDKMDLLLDKIKDSNTIVMIGPCYVTSYPADTINLLMSMANGHGILHGQSLYCFIQGGMPYSHTHMHGLKLLENFADVNEVNFKGGFIMGGGAILDGRPLEKIIGARKIVPAVNQFIDHITKDEYSSEELYNKIMMKMPHIFTKLLASVMNRTLRKQFIAKGIDCKVNPYTSE